MLKSLLGSFNVKKNQCKKESNESINESEVQKF